MRWIVANPALYKVVSDRGPIDDAAIRALMRETLRRAMKQDGKSDAALDQAMLEMRAMVHGLARLFVDGHLPKRGIDETRDRMEAALDASLARLLGKKGGG